MRARFLSIFYSYVLAVLILTLSGFVSLVNAAAPCNETDFTGFYKQGTKTVAITKNAMTWDQAQSLAQANGGNLVSILDGDFNDSVIRELSSSFSSVQGMGGESGLAWIGLYDPNKIPNYCQGGINCKTDDSRFEWVHNFTAFRNWADGQPENLCTDEEKAVSPFKCYGENWAAIGSSGKWRDVGDHGPTPLQLPGIVEFPTVLDCATDPGGDDPGELDLDFGGAAVCMNQAKTRMNACKETVETAETVVKKEDGSLETAVMPVGLCPEEMVSCTDGGAPVCTGGGKFDTQRGMCQKDAIISCTDGGTYESSIDKCHKSPECSENGTLNGTTDKCEKLPIDSCPEGYLLDESGKCTKTTQDCSNVGGVYNAAKNRCEKSVVMQCPEGFTAVPVEGGNGFNCVRDPICSDGTYSTNFDKCLKPYIQQCPTGYAYVAERNRCEAIPVCSEGTWNPITGKCEQTVVNNQCPTGTLEGDKCVLVETKEPKPGYQSPECRSSVMWCNAAYMDIYAGWTTCNTYYGALGGIMYCISQCNKNCNSTERCDAGWTYDEAANLCKKVTVTDPDQIPGVVIHDPSCPSAAPASAIMDFTNKVCYSDASTGCQNGWTVDASAGACSKPAECSGVIEGTTYPGVVNGATDKCEINLAANCGSLTYDPESFICYSDPYCSQGSYDRTRNLCVVSVSKDCGTYNQNGEVCQTEPKCSLGNYSTELDSCVFDAAHDCGEATDYNWQGIPISKCEAIPTCEAGSYNPVTHQCKKDDATCPLGPYPCLTIADDTSGNKYCSPNECTYNPDDLITDGDDEPGEDDVKPDGEIGEDGNCSGSFYIFNGYDMRCTKYDKTGQIVSIAKLIVQIVLTIITMGAGAMTVLLCNAISAAVTVAADAAMGNLGLGTLISVVTSLVGGAMGGSGSGELSESLIDQIEQVAKEWMPVVEEAAGGTFSVKKCCHPDKLHPSCSKLERQEWQQQAKKECVVIGTYCDSEFIGCLEEKETSCCFNSMLARIIHQQGRKQLKSFQGPYGMVNWGEPKHPYCRGFKPEEFQFLDFSKIDLKEYIDSIVTTHADAVQDWVKQSAEEYVKKMKETQNPEGE